MCYEAIARGIGWQVRWRCWKLVLLGMLLLMTPGKRGAPSLLRELSAVFTMRASEVLGC